ncbi:MAG: hydantoinase/oxoprolinase family protein [Actinobacteria bacterium]|nr:hydantoinase/oxoprolinase family protein [Actinomycetota bacterium]
MRLGCDVGGTFTDLVLIDGDEVRVAKVPSTPGNQSEGVLAGLARLDVDAAAITRFAHGTTAATNAVLERRLARTVLVTTRGFRDLLEIGRQDRPDLYDLTVDRPAPLVTRDLVVEVQERISADGTVLVALDDPGAVAAAVRDLRPEAVAICLLFAFVDDRHERAIADLLDDVPVSRSSDVLPVFREYERASTTTLNAALAPEMRRYLGSLDGRLHDIGLSVPVEVMRSGGGTFTGQVGARYPVHTLLSGPAAGAWGAAAVGRATGFDDVIAFDMGGTSTDVTLVEGGVPATTAEGTIDGLPFAVRTTDIHTVGAGGGSIAWRDAGGALRVGPRSAGADPGPACYGRGGTEPTVTDANVVLGRLPSDVLLGGHLALDHQAGTDAVGRLADDVGLGLTQTALGIVQVVEAHMVKALRVVSVERGKDPRDFTLVPFGGAGALHQAALARQLGCRRVLVPPNPGVLSALGLLTAPLTVDAVRTHLVDAASVARSEIEKMWSELADECQRLLAEQGVADPTITRTADLRYRGQAFELEIPAEDASPDHLSALFHEAHRERYGYDQPGEEVEIVNLRARGEGPRPDVVLPPVAPGRGAAEARTGTVRLWEDDGAVDAARYRRDRLGAGDAIEGPAVVEGIDATVLIAPGQAATVDDLGSLLIEEQ